MERPAFVHEVNVTGTLNVLQAARGAGVGRVVYASSSAVYGNARELPQVEDRIGRPLSPYAATKRINEIDGDLYSKVFGLETVGLRYYNVFGPRQDPRGAYAAVIPCWIERVLGGRPITINGRDDISRDFCFIADVVRANILAATSGGDAAGHVFNIASGQEVTLRTLLDSIRRGAATLGIAYNLQPIVGGPRPGDIQRSVANIALARNRLGYDPTFTLDEGLLATIQYYRCSYIHGQSDRL